ncbi:MAG: GTP cyclohydrolase II [Anaerolineae bacterium]
MDDLVISKISCGRIPTLAGEFQLCVYINNRDGKEHLALVMGDVYDRQDVLVRLHSECFTGDVLGSLRCDCGEQLRRSMALIGGAGRGVLLYLRQEGRGIGLADKLQAYNLQDQGYDTVEANVLLGHRPDERDYTVAAAILADLGVRSVCLLTNNPDKIGQLQAADISVTERVPLLAGATAENVRYLSTKAARMGHLLDVEAVGGLAAVNGRV